MNKHDIQNLIFEKNPAESNQYKRLGDIECAKLHADILAPVCRYNTTLKSYMYYDGIVWRRDEDNKYVEGKTKLFAKGFWYYSADKEKFVREVADRMMNYNNRVRLIKDSAEVYHFSNEDADSRGELLNTQNCEINLETFEVVPNDASHLHTKVINARFDADAKCELWEQTLLEIFEGDADRVRLIQQIFGLCLTAEVCDEKFFIFYGLTTRNGKSTILDTFRFMLGSYAWNIQPESLERKKKDSRQASGDIAILRGMRLVQCTEPDKGMILDVELIKQITGGEVITARHLHEREIEFYPVLKLIINTNHLPQVYDSSLFDSDRVIVIPFERHFKASERDKNLKRKLKNQKELSGLLNWCLEGLKDYRENGLVIPESVANATQEYSERDNKLKSFCKDSSEYFMKAFYSECVSTLPISEVYLEYKEWCEDCNLGVDSKKAFIQMIKKDKLFEKNGRYRGQSFYNGINLSKLIQYAELYEDEPEDEAVAGTGFEEHGDELSFPF